MSKVSAAYDIYEALGTTLSHLLFEESPQIYFGSLFLKIPRLVEHLSKAESLWAVIREKLFYDSFLRVYLFDGVDEKHYTRSVLIFLAFLHQCKYYGRVIDFLTFMCDFGVGGPVLQSFVNRWLILTLNFKPFLVLIFMNTIGLFSLVYRSGIIITVMPGNG